MKKLILFSLFPSIVWATQVQEIISSDDGKAIASTIKDIEVKGMLSNSVELQKCLKDNAYKPDADKDAQVKNAQKCFQEKISGNEEKLKELSEKLSLQSYGLVKSSTVKDIQNYLNDKMYEIMTGVNLKEQNRKKLWDSMKFKNKKQIDQGIFVTLYKAQLSKNALFEISRYCFEDLRNGNATADSSTSTFGEHWKGKNLAKYDVSMLNDFGLPKFGTLDDSKDKTKIYESLFNSLGIGDKASGEKGFPVAQLSDFFTACGFKMVELCDEFKKKEEVAKTDQSDVDVGLNKPALKGAASCLAKARLQEIKKAIAASELLEKDFQSMSPTQLENALLATEYQNGKYKLFKPDAGDNSIDSLTNYSSAEFLEGGYGNNAEFEHRVKDCEKNAELPACDGIVGNGETFDKAKHDIEMQMSLKREIEIKRIRELKAGDAMKLKEYLEQNGYYSIIDKVDQMTPDELSKFISEEFEAKKVAILSEINRKLGKRQVSKADANNTTKVTAAATEAIKETKEERARLAQVVLFNNVITSYLTLHRLDDKGKELGSGRNMNPWTKEEKGLKQANVKSDLFQNLQSKDSSNSNFSVNENEQLAGKDLIDMILGKKPASQSKP